ncbi:transglycosylase domain-containing protein [Flavobacterium sp. RHBU_3]|uniref:transglycosylase domain-containing protein n=1 Tax=Flavobacterium sp. RHBU_3 TaxID=3391184 RepID=UPI003984EFB6
MRRKLNYKKIVRRLLITLAILLALFTILFFAFRNMALKQVIARVKNKAAERNATFEVREANFDGIAGVSLKGVSITPNGKPTFMSVEEIKTSVSLGHLLVGDVQLGTLHMKNGYVQMVRDSLGWNFRSLLRSKNDVKEEADTNTDYADRAYGLLNRVLNLVPTDMELHNLELRVDDNGHKVNLKLDNTRLADNQLESTLRVAEDTIVQTWKVSGMADPRGHQCDLKFFNADTGRVVIPYVARRFHLKSGFDAINLKVDKIGMDGGELHVDGYASIKNFMVNNRRIASKDVVINNARFDYHLRFGDRYIEMDSTSTVQLNNVKLHPFARYSVEEDTIYQFKANIPKMQAQDFITSLPTGLFTHFEGMEAQGSFSYRLDFLFNKNKPNALVFDSTMDKDELKITKYGAADLAKLNTAFTYRAIEDGRAQRAVVVGTSNPNYTQIGDISPFLRKAVLTSEDPSFFSHRGFITEAFRQSLIANIKTRKFTRGGSTISMQLVKNVFLTREKTLSRKLEEILLVYILENQRVAGKERMLEVYFNIIEWGPDVYGIGEASRYYFDKHPSELTLDECVYLASIIPSPKKFMYRFDSEGNLKGYALKHDNYIKNIMLRRGLISTEDTIAQNGNINVIGRARNRLPLSREHIFANDSINVDEFFENLGKLAY